MTMTHTTDPADDTNKRAKSLSGKGLHRRKFLGGLAGASAWAPWRRAGPSG